MSSTCRLIGHSPDFTADGSTLRWSCRRCGSETGSKHYATAAEAQRYAAAFNRRDSDDLGRRAPLVGLFPLRLWRRWRSRS
jgi:hypothetical protein